MLLTVSEEDEMTQSAQTILVSGSNSGFGRLIVETLAHQGHIVFAGMREPSGKNASAAAELRALADQEQLGLHVVALDITDATSVNQAVEQVVTATNRLDVVVNNAGVSYIGPIEAFSLEQVQQQFDTNVFGVLRVNNAALPHMRAQKSGLLVQVGSIVGRLAFPFLGLYGATKFALEGLTESYRYELAALGIDAVIVEPGTFPTNISANRQTAADQERFAPYLPVMNAFMPAFFADNRSATPPDPQAVADAIANLIAQPAGQRPLRTIIAPVSQRQAPQEVNAAAASATQSYLEGLGILPQVTLGLKQRS
jgi:NAD(P)-dependent dehydrogenase (short-subunit alcohol dehydrogenase family)